MKQLVLLKEICLPNTYMSYVMYNSLTVGHNVFFESKGALKSAKKYAKEKGFDEIRVTGLTYRTKDKIHKL